MSSANRRTQAAFECTACSYRNHADVVSAMNVLERGLRLLACGEPVQLGHFVKQEASDATSTSLSLVAAQ
ncbi:MULTISPECIES: transposase [unclassified Duganella]|uniref:transposase n=1 Tax=unclassified Duganella TaxID=2636909 RepID=UPI0019109FC5|nr:MULTISPECIES: transposase [unclassified Duganella]